jgi:ER degradation enhancer, mannosidase alpha-like 2
VTARLAAALIFLLVAGCTRTNTPAPAPVPNATAGDPEMAERVRTEFLHAWNGYKQHAWGHDDLKPLSKSYRDWYAAPLLMTPVDSLDTMILMGLKGEADRTRAYIVQNLSFDRDFEVKNFEVTIRLLGGLISAYQLSGDKRLLALADDLGTRLLPAFDSPTGMPYVNVNLKTGAVSGKVTNPAEIGTLIVEFGALSKLTGKPVYYQKAKRALVAVYERRSKLGLVGTAIDVDTGIWRDTRSHISGRIDSYYEYLLKCSQLFDDPDCKQMWEVSIAAANKYLGHETPNGLWYSHVDMHTGERVGTYFGALDAFMPGVLALGGDFTRARALQESAYLMWTTFGIEPERMDYLTMKVTSPGYPLRPEIMESAYILYAGTHDRRYLQQGRTFLDSLIAHCRLESGYAALRNVETKEKADHMESFFLAETLKYLYLLAAPNRVDLKKNVFNTEAHPIRKDW